MTNIYWKTQRYINCDQSQYFMLHLYHGFNLSVILIYFQITKFTFKNDIN